MSGAARSLVHLSAALLLGLGGTAAQAQQAVRLPSADGKPPTALAATLFKPASAQGPARAVALFHGCGGVGMNVSRMAQRLAGQGIAALVVDSFGPRRITDACTRNWPSVAQAADRTRDIDTAVAWLRTQPFVAADRIAVMGYSYGGGVVLMRSLRRELTEAERVLWRRLRRQQFIGARFRRQAPIGPYIADFVCLKSRLIIEIDGSQHVEAATYDARRDAFLKHEGFTVLRFWNNDVLARADSVMEAIFVALDRVRLRHPPSALRAPSPSGEGIFTA